MLSFQILLLNVDMLFDTESKFAFANTFNPGRVFALYFQELNAIGLFALNPILVDGHVKNLNNFSAERFNKLIIVLF